jgi:hypothetical protein
VSESWAERQRETNRLVRAAADYLFGKPSISGDQLYGLCKLTWITSSFDGADASYVRSTKIPALGHIFSRNYDAFGLDQVAADIASITGKQGIKRLIRAGTGFTNFYKAYRNSARLWISDNRDHLVPLFKAAHKLKTDDEGASLIRKLERLPGIPKANHLEQLMRPEYLLTPAFFSLDPRLRFPLINGNEGVRNLLSRLDVANASLEEQYRSMTALYGKAGIKDAADLDQTGRDLPDFIEIRGHKPTKRLLEAKPTQSNNLPLKDESDVKSLQTARSITNKRIHNKLTNKLKVWLSDYTLLEGANKAALFDVLVKNYDGKNADLLIEVKSSIEPAHIRMAIGQLFDYWFRVKRDHERNVAILLPSAPTTDVQELLDALNIGVLWFSEDTLYSSTRRLIPLTSSRIPQ